MNFEEQIDLILDRATDEQFNELLQIAKAIDPSGELHDRLQFHRQIRHNPAFREFVANETRRVLNVA